MDNIDEIVRLRGIIRLAAETARTLANADHIKDNPELQKSYIAWAESLDNAIYSAQ